MRKLVLILLEIIIGISLICFIFFLGIDKIKAGLDACPSYTVVFKDVDGLGVGSPVRLMGLQVGHVTKLELLESEIYVTFRITEKATNIPHESVATISFTGLAGSKSLEIMPPKTKSSKKKKIIISEEPIRVNSVMEVQTAIFENVLEFCRGILAFLSKESLDVTRQNFNKTSQMIQKSNTTMDETLKNINESGEKINQNTKEFQQFLDEQNKIISSTYQSIDKLSRNKNLQSNVETIQSTVKTLKGTENTATLTQNLNNLNSSLQNFNKKLEKTKNREIQYVDDVNSSIQKATDNMQFVIDAAKVKFQPTEQPEVRK
jgi:phospholipid/cholesterol/gamma-HCH transport system substrate-binding protein